MPGLYEVRTQLKHLNSNLQLLIKVLNERLPGKPLELPPLSEETAQPAERQVESPPIKKKFASPPYEPHYGWKP